MTTVEFLGQLSAQDVRLWLDGDRLRANAPEGVLTPDLRAGIQARKAEIIALLRDAEALQQQARAVVPLQPQGAAPAIFGVPGHNGDVFCYRALARELGEDQPFFGLQPLGLDGQSQPLEDALAMADYFADQVNRFRPSGPVVIAGFCAGGTVAMEVARRLGAAGGRVKALWQFGTPYPTSYHLLSEVSARMQHIGRVALRHARETLARPTQAVSYLREVAEQRRAGAASVYADVSEEVQALRVNVEQATLQAVRQYVPRPFEGKLCLFMPAEDWRNSTDEPMRWRGLAGTYEEYVGPAGCNGDNMLRDEYAPAMANLVRRHLQTTEDKP